MSTLNNLLEISKVSVNKMTEILEVSRAGVERMIEYLPPYEDVVAAAAATQGVVITVATTTQGVVHNTLVDTGDLLTNVNNYWINLISQTSLVEQFHPIVIAYSLLIITVMLALIIILCIIIKRKLFPRKNMDYVGFRQQDTKTIREKKVQAKPGPHNVTAIGKEKKNEKETTSWFGGLTKHLQKEKSTPEKKYQPQLESNSKSKSWFSFSRNDNSHVHEEESRAKKIDKTNVGLMRKMCGEFREVIRGQNKEEREERQKELAKVRGARSFFQNMDVGVNSNPGIRFRTDQDVMDNFPAGSTKRVATFVPGRISSRYSQIFEGKSDNDRLRSLPDKPPKKRLVNAENIFKNISDSKARTQNEERDSMKSITSKNRWNSKTVGVSGCGKPECIDLELEDVRHSRPQTFKKIANERSKSAHPLQRVTLPDNAWVIENIEDKTQAEKQKSIVELEMVKQARLESLEVIENMEIERPSSRLQEQSKQEALRELEEVKKNRNLAMVDLDVDEDLRDKVFKDGQHPILDHKEIEKASGSKKIPFEETGGDILTPAMVRDLCASIELNETAPVEKSFNVALALAADGLEEAASYTFNNVIDEEFELKKKLLEEELRKIDEEYRSNYIEYTEDILADKILSAAESIQQLAQTFGNDDINLSPSINRLKELKSEFDDDDTNSENISTASQMPKETSLPAKNSIAEMSVDAVDSDPCFGTLNAVPKIKFKSEKDVYNTNSRRNALDLAQFQRVKLNETIKNKFESSKDHTDTIERNCQPKKKIITLDQILIKTQANNLNNEKDIELEIVKTLRRNWNPPEEENQTISKTKLEPGRLNIKDVYHNDTKKDVMQSKEERIQELEEVRKSFAEKRESENWAIEETEKCNKTIDFKPALRSEFKNKMSDNFWLKENIHEKLEDDRSRILSELEDVKQARQMFVGDPGFLTPALPSNVEICQLKSKSKDISPGISKVKEDLYQTIGSCKQPEQNHDKKAKITMHVEEREVCKYEASSITTIVGDSEKSQERGRKRNLKSSEDKQNTSTRAKSLSNFKNAGNKLLSKASERMKTVMKPK